jgi:hypothetical protein
MEPHPDFLERGFMGDEAEVAPRIRGLRVLAKIIACDLLHNKRDDRDNNNTTTDDLRNRLTHDEVSEGQRPLRIHNKTRSRNCLKEAGKESTKCLKKQQHGVSM